MMQLSSLPRELKSNQVLIRFGLRMIILVVFAALGGIGFGNVSPRYCVCLSSFAPSPAP